MTVLPSVFGEAQTQVTQCYTVLHAGGSRHSVTVLPTVTDITLLLRVTGGKDQDRRYNITDSHWCNAVLHCVTGGEDQDRALQYYRQSLVERRRYADVAPGDLVAPLNNIAMQYSQRGDFGK